MDSSRYTSANPFMTARADTASVMGDVLIGLVPCVLAALWTYGWDSLLLVLVCAASCVIFEAAARKLMGKTQTAGDLSAAVTGVILALCLPCGLPAWMGVLGSFIAIVIVKQLFGGIGKNFVNPALTAYIVLSLSFPSAVNSWTVTEKMTPVIVNAAGGAPAGPTAVELFKLNADLPANLEMLTGLKNGPMGQAWTIAVLIGGVWLAARKVISPATVLSSCAAVFIVAAADGFDPLFHILAGGVLFCGIFMAGDYTTTPQSTSGKLVFGALFGVITMFFRVYSTNPDGAVFALLLMNLLTPWIDRFTAVKPAAERRNRI